MSTYYKITNLEIGYADSPSEFCFDGNLMPGELLYSPFSMTLVQGEGHNILVDTGINVTRPHKKALADAAFIENAHDPAQVLASAGVSASDIDAVFLTHLHFDHAGGIDCFPNAVFYVQEKELEGWETLLTHKKISNLLLSVDPEDFAMLRELEKEGRLVLLNGSKEDIFPGISVMGFSLEHSFASQAVLVRTGTGDLSFDAESGTCTPDSSVHTPDTLFIIAGDIGRYPENYLGSGSSPDYIFNVKFGIGSPYHLALAYEQIFQAAEGDCSRIIMTHDGTKAERYPGFKTGLGLHVSIINGTGNR